jgi:hypothetical protein
MLAPFGFLGPIFCAKASSFSVSGRSRPIFIEENGSERGEHNLTGLQLLVALSRHR